MSLDFGSLSFIHVHSVWRQGSESEDPVTFSLPSPLCAVSVDLLDSSHFQVFCGVVGLAEVRCNWFICLPRPDVGAVSVHSDVKGILRLSDILQATPLA